MDEADGVGEESDPTEQRLDGLEAEIAHPRLGLGEVAEAMEEVASSRARPRSEYFEEDDLST
ncbi:MAG: hypothetical protein M3Q48_14515 [Actinomycetota bacterium]|nr:hypothetical protein [Actinomycetota bacterium]